MLTGQLSTSLTDELWANEKHCQRKWVVLLRVTSVVVLWLLRAS